VAVARVCISTYNSGQKKQSRPPTAAITTLHYKDMFAYCTCFEYRPKNARRDRMRCKRTHMCASIHTILYKETHAGTQYHASCKGKRVQTRAQDLLGTSFRLSRRAQRLQAGYFERGDLHMHTYQNRYAAQGLLSMYSMSVGRAAQQQ
jgi:hypothetical protein